MKDNGYSTVMNWHYITVSLIFAVAILLMVLYMPSLREIDSYILESVRKALPPSAQYLPAFMNELARYYYVWPLVASGSVLISHKYYLEAFLLIFFTQAAYPLNNAIKGIVCRQRPDGCIYPGYSFPSNHAVVAACFFGILIYLVIKHTYGFWKYFLTALFSIMIIFAGVARLWLGVHFLTDVLEGFLLGFIMVNLYIILDKFFSKQ